MGYAHVAKAPCPVASTVCNTPGLAARPTSCATVAGRDQEIETWGVIMRDVSGQIGHITNQAVVIAGAGPTGLVLAAELALAGVDVAIVERRRLARTRTARAHHRGLRSARRRRSLPVGGAGRAGGGVFVHPARHRRLPHASQLRARARAEARRAHPGRVDRRAAGAAIPRARGDGLRAGRDRRARGVVRRRSAPRAVPRGL